MIPYMEGEDGMKKGSKGKGKEGKKEGGEKGRKGKGKEGKRRKCGGMKV